MPGGGAGGAGGGERNSLKHAPAGARESLKLETGRLLGLMTNFLVRGDDHKATDPVADDAEVCTDAEVGIYEPTHVLVSCIKVTTSSQTGRKTADSCIHSSEVYGK